MMKTNTQRGAMLIEVLVAMLLSAVALLALASVNAAAMRYTKMSQYRTLATLLATDIGERLRTNKAGFVARAYDYSASFADQSAAPSLPAQVCASAASVCTASDIAALDLAQWRVQARHVLPQGAVFLSTQADAVAADVWLAWRDPLLAGPDEAPALSTECPAGLGATEAGVRCSYFRINL